MIFSADILQAIREWQDILLYKVVYILYKVLRGEKIQNSILYLARLSLITEGKMRQFTDNQKLKQSIIIKRP